MQLSHRYVTTLFLTAALAAPMAVLAVPAPQEVQVRVYDRSHKDYHNWNDNENRAWGAFLTDNHRNHHEYAKASKREQGQYWNYRHSHPDRD